MDVIVYLMDDFTIHAAPLVRRLPSGLPVETIGYCHRKRVRVGHAFETVNFSFILSGGGTYLSRGKVVEVEAPCVITQLPGETMDYGPSGRWETWEELYLVYAATQLGELRRRGLVLERKPLWPVRRDTPMREQLTRLFRLLNDPAETGAPDRIDRACELLVVESRLGESRPPLGRDEALVRTIRQHVQTHYLEHHDFDALAREQGVSPTTFRRYWERYVHMPPARYVMKLKMREACRLLVESDQTVAEIAATLGFEDPLYFSRRFAAMLQMPATDYRRRHRIAAQ
ncbi:MAG: AraC family transcriptional regulator [Kiritimatiellae bacterium]|nr:AraC family transcriptional regulator [Kiritimatiellia bacterium]